MTQLAQAADSSLLGAGPGTPDTGALGALDVPEAPADFLTGGGASAFAQLGDKFAAATPGTWADVGETRPGRCFDRESPDAALPVMLVSQGSYLGIVVKSGPDQTLAPAAAFDHYSEADRKAADDVLAGTVMSGVSLPATLGADGLEWKLDFEPNGRPDISYRVRRLQDDLIVEGDNLIANNVIYRDSLHRSLRNVPVGPLSRCYFFRRAPDAGDAPAPARSPAVPPA